MGPLLTACLSLLLLEPASTQAPSPSEPHASVYDFENDAIAGELLMPDGELLATAPHLPSPAKPNAAIRQLIQRAIDRTLDPAGRLELAQLLTARSQRRFVRAIQFMDAADVARRRGDTKTLEQSLRKERSWLDAEARDRRAALVQLSHIPRTTDRETLLPALELRLFLLSHSGEDHAKADAVARLIVQTAPHTALAAQAHVRIADRLFVQSSLDAARAAYDAAIATPGAAPVIVSYALYKRAWVEFNAADFDQALASFEAARRVATTAGPSGRALRREAATDIMRILAIQGVDPTTAIETIEGLTEDRARRTRLAERYEAMLRDSGRNADANRFSRVFATAV